MKRIQLLKVYKYDQPWNFKYRLLVKFILLPFPINVNFGSMTDPDVIQYARANDTGAMEMSYVQTLKAAIEIDEKDIVHSPMYALAKFLNGFRELLLEDHADEIEDTDAYWQDLIEQFMKIMFPLTKPDGIVCFRKGVFYWQDKEAMIAVQQELDRRSTRLPGMKEQVTCPENCESYLFGVRKTDLRSVIIHVNDRHRWDRHKLADWLDGLYDKGMESLAFKEA